MHTSGTPDRDADATDISGRVLLGRFRVEKVLGRGGMGEVLLAYDMRLHGYVALKHVRPDGPQAADRRKCLFTEARRARQVSDRHVAAIYDVLDHGNDVLIVMEYVDGGTLRDRLSKPFTLEEFWRLSGECLAGLRAAHAHGVIHRDIKPENLMLTSEQEIKILDFGIALRSERHSGEVKPDDSTSSIAAPRTPAGTPRYMAPEAHYGGHIDERTDIFSLGAVFYEMLTLQHPFEGGGYATILNHIMNSPPEPVSKVNPAISQALSGVIERMMARDPANRFASCEEVAAALDAARAAAAKGAAAQETSVADAPRERGRSPAPKPRPTRRALRVLAAVGVAAAGVVIWIAMTRPSLPRERLLALLLPSSPGATPEFAAFAFGSVELLAARLQRHQDRPEFQLALFGESQIERLTAVPDARKLLGANLALVTSFEQSGDMLSARLELRDPLKGRLIGRRRVVMPQSEPLAWADSLYHASIALLGLPRRRPGDEPGLGVRGAGTLRFLAQGIGRAQSAESEIDLARAREDLEAACRMEPGASLPREWLAAAQLKTYHRTKLPQWLPRAEASARSALALDGKRAESHRLLGDVLVLLKRAAESVAEYRLACELDPTRDEAWMGYGRSRRLVGDPEGERAVYLAAIQSRPHAFRPRWWLANWETRQGHFQPAMAAYREMIRRAPDLSKGYSSLGAMLVQVGEYDRGIDTLHRALALRPSANAYTNAGTAYFMTSKLDECVKAYNQAFLFGAGGYATWLNLGDAYYWLKGQPEQARDAYLQMLHLGHVEMLEGAESGDPPNPLIPADMATVFPKLGQPDSARIYLRSATAIDSGVVNVQYSAALTHWQLGERERALDWLERAVAGGYPRAWIHDSPVHKEWRTEPRFNALLEHTGMASHTTPPPGTGGGR